MIPGRYAGKRKRNCVWRKTSRRERQKIRIDKFFLDCIVFRDRRRRPEDSMHLENRTFGWKHLAKKPEA